MASSDDDQQSRKGKPDKGYLSAAVDSINPWAAGSRSSTPTPKDVQTHELSGAVGDHSTTHLYGRTTKTYPAECPRLNVLWFHAVDIPKRKPQYLQSKTAKAEDTKTVPQPKKYVSFSSSDSASIEIAYQKLLEDAEKNKRKSWSHKPPSKDSPRGISSAEARNTALESGETENTKPTTRVPVNEDYLFDVDIERRELGPVYWLGPIYEVRRGTWFYQEGLTLRPCEENLAAQLEEGYLKVKPWLYSKGGSLSTSQSRSATPKASAENLKAAAQATKAADANSDVTSPVSPLPQPSNYPQNHRLFGTYMNNYATYQDENTAWLTSDGMLSWVTSTMYERFAGGAFMSGIKLVRGWSDLAKPAETKVTDLKVDEKSVQEKGAHKAEHAQGQQPNQHSVPLDSVGFDTTRKDTKPHGTPRESRLQRQLSTLVTGEKGTDAEKEEEFRSRAEEEIQDDYKGQAGETQGREIEHLFLITHGIGQLLGMRMESMNFVHDVNVMRKTLKSVYSNSTDLQALNSELGDGPKNSRVQVLPVCWRHLIDFPRKREKKAERDIGDTATDEDEYPSLEDITIEGVAFARSLISDLALDVLLYQSAYREQISQVVLKEANRIHDLFMERNPSFKGKIHIVGHSLGSAIMFDILCRQKEKTGAPQPRKNPMRFWPPQESQEPAKKQAGEIRFNFDVDDLYCLGSPVGLFQMLKGRTISARHQPNALPSESPLNPDLMDDPFLTAIPPSTQRVSPITGLHPSVSSPKVAQLFNIFHPSDPISYRMEPLISSTMSSLKPQILPYTKKSIFDNVAPQGLSGIGLQIGQSVSGLWSSLSAGIASNILNRSLGLTSEDVAKMNNGSTPVQTPGIEKMPDGVTVTDASALLEKTNRRKRRLADSSAATEQPSSSGKDMTLIDDDLETLFSRFQAHRSTMDPDDDSSDPKSSQIKEERNMSRMRKEDLKVRALNRNGRVDYSIQESVLDFNPMNTIASHMSYWGDEDVNHFILSQILSNKTESRKT